MFQLISIIVTRAMHILKNKLKCCYLCDLSHTTRYILQ